MMMRWMALALMLCVGSAGAQQLQMAITFDDLPAHGEKPADLTRLDVANQLLATFKREHLPPVYGFINGRRAEESTPSEAVFKAWRDAGQPLGNHTWAHLDLEDLTAEQFEAETAKNEPLLKQYMGDQDWHWLRYPYLHEGETLEKRRAVLAWLKQHDYKVAEVSMDFEDYLWNAPYARCVAQHNDAAIQKLHDSYLATADEYITVFRTITKMVYGHDIKYVLLMHVGAFDGHMLPELLALYRQRGFTFISLPDAIADPAYAQDPDIGMKGGGAIQELMMSKLKLKFPPNSKPYKELAATCN